jgi:Flp pilus assembly protein CpaB
MAESAPHGAGFAIGNFQEIGGGGMQRILTFGIGVVSILTGIGLAYYAYTNYARNIEVQQLPVPLEEIAPNTLLTADMFVIKEYPRALVGGYMTDIAALAGRVSTGRLPAGFPVPAPLAADPIAYRLAPPEKTVISVPVTPSVAVGGELQPGMRIDIYRLIPPRPVTQTANLDFPSDTPEPLARPTAIVEKIVSGVVVVGIFGDQGRAGQSHADTSSPLGSGQPVEAPARILVLALTPQEAQLVLGLIAETKRDALMWIGLTSLREG